MPGVDDVLPFQVSHSPSYRLAHHSRLTATWRGLDDKPFGLSPEELLQSLRYYLVVLVDSEELVREYREVYDVGTRLLFEKLQFFHVFEPLVVIRVERLVHVVRTSFLVHDSLFNQLVAYPPRFHVVVSRIVHELVEIYLVLFSNVVS